MLIVSYCTVIAKSPKRQSLTVINLVTGVWEREWYIYIYI